jgi:hypothetical protein
MMIMILKISRALYLMAVTLITMAWMPPELTAALDDTCEIGLLSSWF